MISKPTIALYLGETYATLGIFDSSDQKKASLLFEKSVFLPQTSLKNLLNQAKVKFEEHFKDTTESAEVYIVTKYFDRLKIGRAHV